MASRKQRRLQKKAASTRRFQAAASLKSMRPAFHLRLVPQVPASIVTRPAQFTDEPKILAEDIGKLVDFGVEQKAVDYLYKAGARHVRDVRDWGKARIREIYGMKSRFDALESALRPHGVTIPG
jgi:hypothetical protein